MDYPTRPITTVPCMPRINGKRFYCEVCGVGVFGHDEETDRFYCNGCGTIYQGEKHEPSSNSTPSR